MRLGVVVPCHRQEVHLPRTLAALERSLAEHDWSGVLACSEGTSGLPALSGRSYGDLSAGQGKVRQLRRVQFQRPLQGFSDRFF